MSDRSSTFEDNISSGGMKVCSECGRQFYVASCGNWTYKVPINKGRNSLAYQCSYTCHSHAELRYRSYKKEHISRDNFIKYVKTSESSMKAQGKEVLHPIKV